MLPTALISNTLNLGAHEMLDTTDYLLKSLDTWERLGMKYDLAYIGYITGQEQAKKLCAVADKLRAKGVPVLLDPILGDNGKKYNSVSEEQVEGMKMLSRHVDLITPNLTELCLLLDKPFNPEASKAYVWELAQMSKGSVLATSAATVALQMAMLGYELEKEQGFAIHYDPVPGHRWGTGDLFTALLMDGLLGGKTLEEAARTAGAHVAAQLRGEEESLLPEQ